MNLLEYIKEAKKVQRKLLAILIDPDKVLDSAILISKLRKFPPDLIFVGGSRVEKQSFDLVIETISNAKISPVVIFPGDYEQINDCADAILLLSLISGRNPDYLIGQHVKAAKALAQFKGDVIPTSYLLIEGGKRTSVQEISQTEPMDPADLSLIRDTVIAGRLLGHQLHYLEAGSGAKKSVSLEIIETIKNCTSHPIIVGGGIRDPATAEKIWQAGADVVVVGNGFEDRPSILEEFRKDLS